MNIWERPDYQYSINTGGTHTGIIFAPFGTDIPSDYSAVTGRNNAPSARRVPISSGNDGWTERPDAGGSSLEPGAAPVGDPVGPLFLCALIYLLLRHRHKPTKLTHNYRAHA